mmetsp:Transcript_42187/g.101484  ORF Transcript_42187/g.101484 Transcript_42187/m.101484 type:complete len:788 (+) Transcript_42187:210-2573(+)
MPNVVVCRASSREDERTKLVEPMMVDARTRARVESSSTDGQSVSKRRHDNTDRCQQQSQPYYLTVKHNSNAPRFCSSQIQHQRRNHRSKQRSRIQRWTVPTACSVLLALSSSPSSPSHSFPTVFGYPQTTHQHHQPMISLKKNSNSCISRNRHRYIIDDDILRESSVFNRRSLTTKLHLSHRGGASTDVVWTFVPSPERYYCAHRRRSGGKSRLAATSSSSDSDPEDEDQEDKITNVNEPVPPLEVVESPSSSKTESEKDVRNNTNTNNGRASISPIEKLDRRLAKLEAKYVTRISRLEEMVSRQEVELHKLRKQCAELGQVSKSFADLLNLLRESPSLNPDGMGGSQPSSSSTSSTSSSGSSSSSSSTSDVSSSSPSSSSSTSGKQTNSSNQKVIESFDDAMIFGRAPSSVIDAADAAGTAILAGMLGGKQRMLIDVRDAELSSDPETLVQFIELSILPVAAGLEGLKSTRNRVKIVFPKVSQLLEYRRTMALAAPEVVALSTLDFDPVEENDKLVVVVAPEPDDDEGIDALKNLLAPVDSTGVANERQPIQQPVVLLNYHMHPPPVSGLEEFETAYHLRLLAVQYMSATAAQQYMEQIQTENDKEVDEALNQDSSNDLEVMKSSNSEVVKDTDEEDIKSVDQEENDDDDVDVDVDDELESAVKHAHDVGMNQGTTRAMVIRAFPRPWHVFVDVSPDTDADFEVAATFDDEPTPEELNMAIVECLEGSEREDELVAQQMQQALEEGQLDNVSDMISKVLNTEDEDDDDDDDEDDDDDFYVIEEDSV